MSKEITTQKCIKPNCDTIIPLNKKGHQNTTCLTCRNLLKHYGITRPERDEILKAQGNLCKICQNELNGEVHNTQRPHVDHCHKTGKIRGILCGRCNTAIGLLKEDTDNMKRAITYMKE